MYIKVYPWELSYLLEKTFPNMTIEKIKSTHGDDEIGHRVCLTKAKLLFEEKVMENFANKIANQLKEEIEELKYTLQQLASENYPAEDEIWIKV